ncbi:LON-1 protein [Aphelenchoides avenae]|nr:LON-1 protein [Aphelenchus avenae]
MHSSESHNVKFLTGEAEVSRSDPSNDDTNGNGNFVHTEPVRSRRKRSPYFNGYGTQGWPDLLLSSEAPNDYLKMWITNEHNRYRRMVPATNMRMLYWSEELAASAQRHANRCDFRHSRDRVNVGENIWAAPYANYSDAISRWFNEVNNPWCQCNHAYKHCCGHYVQVVWAQSSLVGCGYAHCQDVWGVYGRGHRHVFVCHYNPQGNTVYVTGQGSLYAVPAFTWATDDSQRCRDCPPDAPSCHEGLCYMPKSLANGRTDPGADENSVRDDKVEKPSLKTKKTKFYQG